MEPVSNSVKSPGPQPFPANLTEFSSQIKMLVSPTDGRCADQETAMGLLQVPERVQLTDSLLTAEQVAVRLNVTRDWVWDHSSRRLPYLPVIRMSDGALRYRASQIDEFVNERERASVLRRKRR